MSCLDEPGRALAREVAVTTGTGEAQPLHLRGDMRGLLILCPLALLSAPQPAEASCNGSTGPFVVSTGISLDCPLVIYQKPEDRAPTAHVIRDGAWVEVTGTVDHVGQLDLEHNQFALDCHGAVTGAWQSPVAYDIYNVTLAGAAVGEYVWIHEYGTTVGPLAATATCGVGDDPGPYCRGLQPPCESEADDETGCSVGGGAHQLALLGIVVAFVGSRRRRSLRNAARH